jgi:hypothetical protein
MDSKSTSKVVSSSVLDEGEDRSLLCLCLFISTSKSSTIYSVPVNLNVLGLIHPSFVSHRN